jgi:O-antigen ligase
MGTFSILIALIFFTQSRAGLFSLASAILGLQLLAHWKKPRRAFLAIVIFAVILIVGMPRLVTIDPTIEVSVTKRFQAFNDIRLVLQDQSLKSRMRRWHDGVEMLGTDIWVGRGFSSYAREGFFDSGYIDYLYVGGVVSVVLFILMCLRSIARIISLIKARAIERDRAFIVTTGCAVLGSMLISAVSHPILYNDKIWLIYFTVIVATFISIGSKKLPTRKFPARSIAKNQWTGNQDKGGSLPRRIN